MAVICDLDGVVWLGDEPIPGSAEAVERLRAAGRRVLFVTNNSAVPVGEVEAKLARHGIPAEGDVLTSAMAAAHLLAPGQRALAAAGPGVVEALGGRGVEVVPGAEAGPHDDVDAVVVGLHLDFDYRRLRVASDAVRRGARFVATNTDATYPTPDGPIPGGGAIVAAVAVAAGVDPEVAGKPHAPMAELVRGALGPHDADELVMVGDRWETDGAFARALGARFALVLTGVTAAPAAAGEVPAADLVAADLAEVATRLTASRTA